LLPFSVAVEGKVQKANDVVDTMKMYLFSKLSESFESLEWILLGASSSLSDENRKLQEDGEVVFLSGKAIFLDPERIPTVKEVQRAQREALELIIPLEEFVKGQGFLDWVITLVGFHETEEESSTGQENVSLDDSTNLDKDDIMAPGGEDEKDKNRTALITVLALIAAILCMASFVLRRFIEKKKADSSSRIGLAVNPPAVPKTTTEAPPPSLTLTPTPTSTSTSIAANNETTKVAATMNWGHVFRLSTEGIEDLEDVEISTTTTTTSTTDASEKQGPSLHSTIPALEQTETVVLQGLTQANNHEHESSTSCSSDDSSSDCDYIRNRSYTLPPVREEEDDDDDRTTALVDCHDEVLPSGIQYYPSHPYSNMLGPSSDESSEEMEVSDSVCYV
jgi:hypothetical protein